jgi:hypothetical protein
MKSLLQIACLCLLGLCSLAQNITILPSGITPAGSSWPSLSYEEILALPSPQRGNMAIDITFDCLRFYNGKKWVRLLTEAEFNMPSMKAWSEGGTGIDKGMDIAVDNNGNIYVAGIFANTATFGNTTLTSSGQSDVFVAKYNKNGELLWVRKAGGSDAEEATGIAIDANGNVFIGGHFYNTMTIGNTNLMSVGSVDFFLAKYDTNGNFKWAQSGGNDDADKLSSMATDAVGNIYISGNFRGTASFNGASIVSAGIEDIFLAKYNTTGSLLWVQRAGGTNTDRCENILIDANNNIYMTGEFYGTSFFGNVSLTSSGSSDMFIAKYNTNTYSWSWAKSGGGSSYDVGKCIAISSTGTVFLTGTFNGAANFGNAGFASAGLSDIFITTYTSDGVSQTARRVGGELIDEAEFIGLDANDNVYLIGNFQKKIDFASISLIDSGYSDLFIAKYKSDDNTLIWAQRLGGSDTDRLGGAVARPDGNIYLNGYFGADFNVGTTPITGAGIYDVFIARIKD